MCASLFEPDSRQIFETLLTHLVKNCGPRRFAQLISSGRFLFTSANQEKLQRLLQVDSEHQLTEWTRMLVQETDLKFCRFACCVQVLHDCKIYNKGEEVNYASVLYTDKGGRQFCGADESAIGVKIRRDVLFTSEFADIYGKRFQLSEEELKLINEAVQVAQRLTKQTTASPPPAVAVVQPTPASPLPAVAVVKPTTASPSFSKTTARAFGMLSSLARSATATAPAAVTQPPVIASMTSLATESTTEFASVSKRYNELYPSVV